MSSPCCCPESCALCNLVEQPSWMGSSEIPDPSGYSPAPNGLTAWGWVVGVCAHVLGALSLAGPVVVVGRALGEVCLSCDLG